MPLTEGVFIYETEKDPYDKTGDSLCAVVTGTEQERRFLEVPETLGGLPVRKIAPHALSDKKSLRVVSFPASLRSVGAFALHKCPQLEEISLHDGILDFHNGVVRQDSRLRRIRLTVHNNNYTVMRDILSDTDARLRFCLQLPDGEARLLFPGYDYSFNENTMARTIQFSIHGSGMFYRECVRRKGIGWREYDRLFARVIPDDAHAAAEIAADRLLYPYDLSPVHAEAYEEYLRCHAGEALLQFTEEIAADHTSGGEEEAYRRLQLMADRGLIREETADPALRAASAHHMTEVCSIIMAGREAAFKNIYSAGKNDFMMLEEENEPVGNRHGKAEETIRDFVRTSLKESLPQEGAGTQEPARAEGNAHREKQESGHPQEGAGTQEPARAEGNTHREKQESGYPQEGDRMQEPARAEGNAHSELQEENGTGSRRNDRLDKSLESNNNNTSYKSSALSLDDW